MREITSITYCTVQGTNEHGAGYTLKYRDFSEYNAMVGELIKNENINLLCLDRQGNHVHGFKNGNVWVLFNLVGETNIYNVGDVVVITDNRSHGFKNGTICIITEELIKGNNYALTDQENIHGCYMYHRTREFRPIY